MTQTEALLKIAERDGGKITPAAVIAEAKNPKSVLHGAFTWDDTKAARKWRIFEAQNLIRRCRVTIEQGDKKVETYAFVGLSADRNDAAEHNPYRLAKEVAKNDDLLAIAEKDALEQLRCLKAKYEHLKRFQMIWDLIE